MRRLARPKDGVVGVVARSPRQRALIVFLAAAQFVLPAALSVADGYLELLAPENAVFAHVEAHGTPHCPRVHDEATCAMFHFLSRTGAVKSEAPRLPRVVERIASYVASEGRDPTGRAVLDPTLPRAPPTARRLSSRTLR